MIDKKRIKLAEGVLKHPTAKGGFLVTYNEHGHASGWHSGDFTEIGMALLAFAVKYPWARPIFKTLASCIEEYEQGEQADLTNDSNLKN